ncbi:hypothetical protein CDD83_7677 [Cordyceps sp. RAO-2017]|nr:hypothetical protein CDD83_7677 [Cordyceps sp. RAO-2017]
MTADEELAVFQGTMGVKLQNSVLLWIWMDPDHDIADPGLPSVGHGPVDSDKESCLYAREFHQKAANGFCNRVWASRLIRCAYQDNNVMRTSSASSVADFGAGASVLIVELVQGRCSQDVVSV